MLFYSASLKRGNIIARKIEENSHFSFNNAFASYHSVISHTSDFNEANKRSNWFATDRDQHFLNWFCERLNYQ